MTGDELAAALYAKQGYFVMASTKQERLGSIAYLRGTPVVSTPMRIAEISTREEFIAQAEMAHELCPSEVDIPHEALLPNYYYRVEACD